MPCANFGRLPDLRSLFDSEILEQERLVVGFEEPGSDVIRVRTEREHVVARAFRLDVVSGPFWGGLQTLFAIDPLSTCEVAEIHAALRGTASPLAVPAFLRSGRIEGREWVVVELMGGRALMDFGALSDDGLVELGRCLAAIHSPRFDALGTVSGSTRVALGDFYPRLAAMFHEARADRRLGAICDRMATSARRLAPPAAGALVLPDIAPWQFLERDGRAVALVDLDAYVVGPRELDLVFLEYFVDDRCGRLIEQGYRELLALPALDAVRPVYRLLGYLLTILPGIELDVWMAWPQRFGNG
jgi:hypothetical protein